MPKKKFNCKKCGRDIDCHNQYCHDGMCNNCFFDEYFPKEVQIYETDVNKLPKLCKQNQQENMKFNEFLKSEEFSQESFNKIVKEVEEKIDCTKCGNCCKVLKLMLDKEDIERISKYLNISEDDFINKYLIKNKDGDFEFKRKPCVFLVDNKCKIYDIRPKECKEFPNLYKDVTIRRIQFFANAELCPIVFNVLENVKEEFLEGVYAFEHRGM